MRTCPSCGRENPPGTDFCECGEYLRWEPTNFVQAVSAPKPGAEQREPAAVGDSAATEKLDPDVTLAAEAVAPAPGARAWGTPAAPGGLDAGVAPMPGTPGSGDAPPGAAALMLRLPDGDSAAGGPVAVDVAPGQRAVIVGLIRNQSEVVDNFDLWIRGLPDGWWTIAPATAYLVPYGTGGTYEQELEIHIHPPRTPQAQARPWSVEVVANSRAYGGEVATAPATVTIGPYTEVATELRPERASGRLKARYRLVVHNKANARTQVDLAAEDTDGECRFRFAEPQIALEPGNAMECPFTVFPPRQLWIGRPVDRQFQVKAAATGVETPPVRMAVFRQRAWLPWWLAIVVPVLVALAVLAIKLMPKQAVIPNLKNQPSVFVAQKLLNSKGFVLAPKTTPIADATKPAGSIADQSPAAGTKAKKGAVVTVEVYTGAGSAKVPSVVGDTPGKADQTLRASSLALGAVSPQPLNPAGQISSQIPLAGTSVPNGTAVSVFLAAAKPKGKAAGPGAAAAAAAATAAAAAATAAQGKANPGALKKAAAQAGLGSITVPPVSGSDPTKAAGTLSALGLVPHPLKEVATVPAGLAAGTVPGAGAKVAKGAAVALIISSGSPQLSYDDGQTVHVIDPSTDKPSGVVPPGSGPQVEASWSPDGTHIVYSQNGQLVLAQPNVKNDVPFQMTQPQPGILDLDPSFAPTLKSLMIAFVQRNTATNTAKLCFATIGPNALNADCTSAPGWDLGGQVNWSPDGSTILVFGSQNKGANFGLLAFTSNVPLSTQASDWGHGTLETDDSVAGHGVVAGAFSPDGKRLALVSNLNSDDFHLYIVKAGDFNPTPADQLPIRACQVSWRSDSEELAVMQPDGQCNANATGTILGVNRADPRNPSILATGGAHPAWQPVLSSG